MKIPEIMRNHSKSHPFAATPGTSWDPNTHGNLLFIPLVGSAPQKSSTLNFACKNSDQRWRTGRVDENIKIMRNHSKSHPFAAIPGTSCGPNTHGNLLFIPPVGSAPQKSSALKLSCKNSDWRWRMGRVDENTRNHAKSLEITPICSHTRYDFWLKYTQKLAFHPISGLSAAKIIYPEICMQKCRLEMENGAD